jgi:GNAT superfamily N-acetyltransferase
MIISELFEAPQLCPECGGISFSDLILAEKKDACYHKVKASAKVWPSAYASGRLVQCRKKGAANYGNKNESVAEGQENFNGIDISMEIQKDDEYVDDEDYDNQVIYVTASSNGKELGHVLFAFDGEYLMPQDLEVEERYRGQGIAQTMYDYVKSKGYKIRRSGQQTDAGTGFWDKHKPGKNVWEQGVAEAKPPGSRRDPFDLPPLEGPGAGSGHQVPQFTVPIIPSNVPGGANMPMAGGPKWTQTKIPGVDIHTGPLPTVTRVPNINKKIDPAAEVPAYVRKGLPDPVTVPKPGTKPKIKVQPGETLDQAIQRTRAEQEFSRFLKGQGGQQFGTAGGGRGGQGGPTAAQATSGSGQVPTIRLPNGQLSVDPYRLSPSGQYSTQSGSRKSIDQIERDDERAVDAMVKRARQSVIDREAKSKNQSDRIEPVQPKWKNRDTDQDLEEARKKREQPEVNYDDEYDAMVARVKKLAGLGPMRTVYNPAKRQYRNMPTAVQPKK